jgi:Ca-activated chloride channel family protein
VRVFTIGFGTTNPAPLACSGSQFGGFGGGGYGGGYGGGFGGRNPLVADYGALQQIAGTTGGKFFRAQNADQLKTALGSLSGTFTIIREHLDIAAWFAAFGGLLIAAALALSLWWNRTRQPPRRPAAQKAAL